MKLEFKHLTPFQGISTEDWESPTWQMRNCLTTLADFESRFVLSSQEKEAFIGTNELFQIRVTPYYARLADATNPLDPIRRILMPHQSELVPGNQAMRDPLGENLNRPTSRIIHRYPDRALFLVTDFCSVYCRYCTRKHFTGKDRAFPSASEYDEALSYIKSHPGIREVILSGGDPLTLSDLKLERVLSDLRSIEHVEIIRIGSRMPVVCPMRITKRLAQMMRRYSPLFFMAHFNHPRELTAKAAEALGYLVDHGIPVMNQMVLLNGVNNHPAIVQALSRRLLYLRVKPYYMFQCDPSEGTDHLRTSVENSLEIQRELWGRLSGLALPNLSLDIPGGGGKVGLVPNFEVRRSTRSRCYRGWDGVEQEYISPDFSEILTPADVNQYIAEWAVIRNGVYGSVPHDRRLNRESQSTNSGNKREGSLER
jgi:lysine 2,3-aminomutase